VTLQLALCATSMATSRVALMCIGTRGDVQPYLALAVALRDSGADVLLFALSSHEELVQSAGIRFVSLGLGFDAAQDLTPEGRAMKAARGPLASRRALQAYMQAQGALYWRAADEALLDFKPDVAVVGTIAAYVFTSLLDLRKVPFLLAHCAPFVPSRHGAPPVFNCTTWRSGCNPLGMMLNRMTWTLAMRADWHLVYQPVVNALRCNHKMAPITHGAGVYGHYGGRLRPVLLMQSPLLAPRLLDYPSAVLVSGRPEVPLKEYAPPADVEAFLRAGQPPVCITLGSMAVFLDRPKFSRRGATSILALAVDSVTDAGARCLVFTEGAPEAACEALRQRPDVLLVSRGLPHSFLFPRCAAVVCHGGAGTVHAALAAGSPCVVVAVETFWDQLWWGQKLVAARLAPAAFAAQKVTRRQLRVAVATCLHDTGLRARCAAAAAATDPTAAASAAVTFVTGVVGDKGWQDLPPL
jgi:sterol 3beta-glucosyltransferase